jgi:hypothetical protein
VHAQARLPGAQSVTPASLLGVTGVALSSVQPDTWSAIGSKAKIGKANQVKAERLEAIRREPNICRD